MQPISGIRRPFRALLLVAFLFVAPACVLAVAEPEAPPQIEVVQGAGQSAAVNQTLPAPVVFRATDSRGRPIAARRITFVIGTGGGSVTPVVSETGADGQVSVVWTLGPEVATQTIIANSSGVGPVTVQAVATDAAPLVRADTRLP
ncbi:MAG: hypothetical protein KJZ74_14800 [Gemmatimonadales bacterium]|nr:hypothetical protein [Gemmatimonadales bacterium]